MINENRNTVLFLSRDGCLLIKLFMYFYPQYKSIYLHSSRIINDNYTDDYISYLKKYYDKESCILFDLHGSFNSGRKLFNTIFGHLPRIFIFDISMIHNYYNGISFITNHSNKIEQFNQDYKGTLIQYTHKDIRAPNETPLKYVDIIHKTIDLFIKYIDINSKNSLIWNDTIFFKNYYINLYLYQICLMQVLLIL